MITVASTKIYKNNQTSIPSLIRKEFDLGENDVVDWNKTVKGDIVITFRKKPLSLKDLAGIGHSKERTNAVSLKRSLYE